MRAAWSARVSPCSVVSCLCSVNSTFRVLFPTCTTVPEMDTPCSVRAVLKLFKSSFSALIAASSATILSRIIFRCMVLSVAPRASHISFPALSHTDRLYSPDASFPICTRTLWRSFICMVLSEILKCPSEPATVIIAVSIVPAVSLLADTLEIWASPMLPSKIQPFAATSSSVVVFSKAANFPERLVICALVAFKFPMVAYPARSVFTSASVIYAFSIFATLAVSSVTSNCSISAFKAFKLSMVA